MTLLFNWQKLVDLPVLPVSAETGFSLIITKLSCWSPLHFSLHLFFTTQSASQWVLCSYRCPLWWPMLPCCFFLLCLSIYIQLYFHVLHFVEGSFCKLFSPIFATLEFPVFLQFAPGFSKITKKHTDNWAFASCLITQNQMQVSKTFVFLFPLIKRTEKKSK